MKWSVEFTRHALKQLGKLDEQVRRRVVRAIQELADEARPPGAKKLVGESDHWRIRVGDYRVVYVIDDGELIVLVVRVAHRSRVYE